MRDRDRELREAIDAAEETLDCLHEAGRYLDSAGNWGLADMFGGGFFTTFMKRSKMGDAKDAIRDAKRAMRRLAKEMRDVDEILEIDIHTDDFLSFADYFFDGFAADVLVQSQISRAKRQLDRAFEEVEMIRDQLLDLL